MNEPTSSAGNWASPSKPTISVDPVNAKIWIGAATIVSCRPSSEMACPVKRRRKSRDDLSGVVSAKKRWAMGDLPRGSRVYESPRGSQAR